MRNQNKIKNIKTNLLLISTLFSFGFRDVSESLIKIFVDLIITFARFAIVVSLYSYLFIYKGGTIMNVNLQTVAWAMFLYYVFLYINPRNMSADIQKDIQTGKIEIILSKPVNYIFYKLGEFLGSKFFTFIVCSLIGSIAMIAILDIPPNILSLHFLITFPVVLLLSFIISFELFAIIGFMSFWIEDVNPIKWITDKSIMILGGAYFPVALFPDILKKISLYSPMGASQFVSYSAYTNWINIYLKMFAIQIFWILILGYILYLIEKRAFLKFSVNGG